MYIIIPYQIPDYFVTYYNNVIITVHYTTLLSVIIYLFIIYLFIYLLFIYLLFIYLFIYLLFIT